MLLPRPGDALHKAMLYRILVGIADDIPLANILRFKGGTCAAMMGYLNRFSVDLDFDFLGKPQNVFVIRERIEKMVRNLGFEIYDQSKNGIQFFLKYQAPANKRNTLKIEAYFPVPNSSHYDSFYFSDIDRTLGCQTIEDMFANKLVSVLDRYEKYHSIAGRDLYDIHSFFSQELEYDGDIIEERRNIKGKTGLINFFKGLITFVKKHFTETILNQDLNMLLPNQECQRMHKILIPETIMFLEDEIKILNAFDSLKAQQTNF